MKSSFFCFQRLDFQSRVAQFDLSSLCMRTPMAQAPDEWLTALQRWATHSSAISADSQWGLRAFLLTPISWTKLSTALTLLSMPVTFPNQSQVTQSQSPTTNHLSAQAHLCSLQRLHWRSCATLAGARPRLRSRNAFETLCVYLGFERRHACLRLDLVTS